MLALAALLVSTSQAAEPSVKAPADASTRPQCDRYDPKPSRKHTGLSTDEARALDATCASLLATHGLGDGALDASDERLWTGLLASAADIGAVGAVCTGNLGALAGADPAMRVKLLAHAEGCPEFAAKYGASATQAQLNAWLLSLWEPTWDRALPYLHPLDAEALAALRKRVTE